MFWKNTKKQLNKYKKKFSLFALIAFVFLMLSYWSTITGVLRKDSGDTFSVKNSPNSINTQNQIGNNTITSQKQRRLSEFLNINQLLILKNRESVAITESFTDTETYNLKLEIKELLLNAGYKGFFDDKSYGGLWDPGKGILIINCGTSSSVLITRFNDSSTSTDYNYSIRDVVGHPEYCIKQSKQAFSKP